MIEGLPCDPGVLVSTMLNHRLLKPFMCQSLCMPTQGVGVEVMTSSDNVLRLGLTPRRSQLTTH